MMVSVWGILWAQHDAPLPNTGGQASPLHVPQKMNPVLPDLTLEIPAPPPDPELSDGGVWLSLLPMLGLGVIAAFYLLRASDSGAGGLSALPLVVLAGLSVVSAVMTTRWRRRDRARRRAQAHSAYLRTLVYKRARLQAAHDAQRGILETAYPTPTDGAQRALNRAATIWARRPGEVGFAAVRLGVGEVAAPVRIITPDPDRAHPLMPQALALAEQYRTLHGVPVPLSLTEYPAVALCGAWDSVSGVLRAWLCGLALAHTPQDMKIHVIAPAARPDEWRWLDWLPHASQFGRGGAADLVAVTSDSARPLVETLGEVLAERRANSVSARGAHLLVIADLDTVRGGGAAFQALLRAPDGLNASLVVLTPAPDLAPPDCRAVVTIAQNRAFWCSTPTGETHGQADALGVPEAEGIARALAGMAQHGAGGAGQLPRRVDFLTLHGVGSHGALVDRIASRWRQTLGQRALPRPVMVGLMDAESALELALGEGQHGPHGMLAGTTGAGKSEFLQTLICALAMEHDPRLLSFLLLDFKGGSTLNGFARLPHTVGILTNLDGLLVERALAALHAELTERQALLKQRGLRDIAQYHRLYTATPAQMTEPGYHPLPHLLIVVDEFAQLARELPEFLAELVRVAQVGRSLGVHLILGTQSPAEVVTDEMAANLQFRLCFRVQSIEASRAVLRRPDAAYLPADWPGRAYLQVGEASAPAQFQTAYAGGEVDLAAAVEEDDFVLELLTEDGSVVNLLDAGQLPTQGYGEADLAAPTEPYTAARAVVDAIIEVAQARGVPFMPPLLLPPLGDHLTLRAAISAPAVWNGSDWPHSPSDTLSAPIGLIDDVSGHAQPPLEVILRGAGARTGHLLITGAPNSGKTTTLLTLALSLALHHPPVSLHLYGLSTGGNGLAPLAGLPHAETPVTLNEPERVRLLLRRLLTRLDSPPDPSAPAVVLLLDGLDALRDPAYHGIYHDLERVLSDGRAAGVYVAATASTVASVPERVRGWMPQRIALQPATPADLTQMVGVVASRVAAGGRVLPPGRGFIPGTPPRLCQICLPTEFPSEDPASALAELADEMRAAYRARHGRDHAPAPVRPLPTRLDFARLAQPTASGRLVTALGVQDADGQPPLLLDWAAAGPHFVVVGPPGAGKTNLLHAAGLSVAAQSSPIELALVLVDFTGRSLAALDGLPHVAAHVRDPEDLASALPHLASDPRRAVVLIDDYDLTSEALIGEGGAALRALRDLARTRTDLHLWAAGYLDRAGDPLIRHLLMKRAGVALGGREALLALNQRAADLPNEPLPPGRGYLTGAARPIPVQTAWVSDVQAAVNHLCQRWSGQVGVRWALGDSPAPPRQESTRAAPLDIDTAGLMDDLLGGGDGG